VYSKYDIKERVTSRDEENLTTVILLLGGFSFSSRSKTHLNVLEGKQSSGI
jgi:hypothetical protein